MKNSLILFEDNHILAANKLAGLATQPTPQDSDSLETRLKALIKERDKKPGGVFLHAVHRLDKVTSGIVLFAKSQKALERLNLYIRKREIKKTYLARVAGKFSEQSGVLEDTLEHGDHRADRSIDGKASRLHYKVLSFQNSCSLVEIDLETGRYHQIRAQMSLAGHPVVGDAKYGSRISFDHEGVALHHAKLSFAHPVTKTVMTLECYPDWLTTQPHN